MNSLKTNRRPASFSCSNQRSMQNIGDRHCGLHSGAEQLKNVTDYERCSLFTQQKCILDIGKKSRPFCKLTVFLTRTRDLSNEVTHPKEIVFSKYIGSNYVIAHLLPPAPAGLTEELSSSPPPPYLEHLSRLFYAAEMYIGYREEKSTFLQADSFLNSNPRPLK